MRVVYATASVDAVEALLAAQYGVPGPLRCRLLNRGFNDCYSVTPPEGDRFVLRLSGYRARGAADVAAETAFLAHLDAVGVPIAAAVPARDGRLFTEADLPDGARPAVLFRCAEGRRPDLDDPGDARRQGVALARVHRAAADYPGRESGRYRLDADHLLHRPVAAIAALGLDAPRAMGDLLRLVRRVAGTLDGLDRDLERTRCHGDCHGLNARIATEGPRQGEATLFDFDDGGFGYLSYDLAVHLWAQVSFGRRRHAMWFAFLEGYRSARPVARFDEEAVHLFVIVRHLWLMGEWAGRTSEWGSEALTDAWLEREVAFLLAWESDRVSPRLPF